jgi:hypothetical protein
MASGPVQDVRVDHGGAHVAVAEKFLHPAAIIPSSRKYVAKE